jgi:hypothetical protein
MVPRSDDARADKDERFKSELKSSASTVANLLGSKEPKAFADNKRWLNRGLKAALSEARAEHARHRAQN